ncbi:MAG: MCE family protein [Flavobacteriales bacterium]|nr:MCE family protein [Flavobacteriales bacterium]
MAELRGSAFKLGAFVLAGITVLVVGLYLLGSKRDLFSRTMDVQARFNEVSGLRVGNNVRYVGIDVGTVERITILSDTLVLVDMMIRLDAAEHIRSNAIARIASDGLMGNKLVSIEPGEGNGTPLTDEMELRTGKGLDTDAMLRSLGRSNDNVVVITEELRDLTERLNSEHGLIRMMSDSTLMNDVSFVVAEIRTAATNARLLTERTNTIVHDMQNGQGALGALIGDPVTDGRVRDLIANLRSVSDSLLFVSQRLGSFAADLDRPGGLTHTLTKDTTLTRDVKRVVSALDTSSTLLNEDLRALQRNWFFRRYFKEKAKGKE